MESFDRITGIVAPFPQANIDTDRIIPSSELVRAQKEGYAASLFAAERYLNGRVPDPTFILNVTPFNEATILVAGENFGTGSSREAAPTALRAFGFRVVIARSFGGIFYNNCFMNGILPIEIPFDDVINCSATKQDRALVKLTVDLVNQTVTREDGYTLDFTVPTIARQMLLDGKDNIDVTLDQADLIETHWQRDRQARPWIDLEGT